MTAAREKVPYLPARELPNGKSFYSPVGLYDFQADHVAEAYLRTAEGGEPGLLAIWDTGLGKTIFGMALAALLFEDGLIDLVVVAAEKNKVGDWQSDFATFTSLHEHRYHGTGRQRRLIKAGTPQVFISSYETLRNELVVYEKKPGNQRPTPADGPLFGALGLREKRILWIFDEVTKVRGRGSQLHKAYAYTLKELRKGPHWQRVVGLTGTPVERDLEDSYNVGRIVIPPAMPTVAKFEERYGRGRDDYGRLLFKSGARDEFGTLFRRHCLIKRKTDDDVIAQFPAKVEKAIWVPLETEHRKLYRAVQDMLKDAPAEAAFLIERLTVGHPRAHLYAENSYSRAIVEAVGEHRLREIGSSKSTELINRLRPLVKGQGAQAVVFSFYGRTVLRALADDLRAAGFSLLEYHGGHTAQARDTAKNRFIAGEAEILLASDAAAKGLNLQNASYVFEYESAMTYATRTQRINRIHRIGSGGIATCYTLIAEDTIEVPIVRKVLARNRDHDAVLVEGDAENYVTAEDRKAMLGFGHKG